MEVIAKTLSNDDLTSIELYPSLAIAKYRIKVVPSKNQIKVVISNLPSPSTLYDKNISIQLSSNSKSYLVKEIIFENSFEDVDKKKKENEEILNKLKSKEKKLLMERNYRENLKNIQNESINLMSNLIGKEFSESQNSFKNLLSENSLQRLEHFLEEFDEKLDVFQTRRDNFEFESLEEIDEEVVKIKKEINLLEKFNYNVSEQISILVHIDKDSTETISNSNDEIFINLFVLLKNVTWNVEHDLVVLESQGNISTTLLSYANIQQDTGLDWENVKLKLSTIIPQDLIVPVLKPNTINWFQKNKKKGFFSFIGSILRKSESNQDIDAFQTESIISNDNLLHTIKLQKSFTIRASKEFRKVPISSFQINENVKYTRHCVPRLDTNVYIKLNAKNISNSPLLKGPVNVYWNSSLISTTRLSTNISVNENFELFIGKDPYLKVQYLKSEPITILSTGLISKHKKYRISKSITAYNSCQSTILAIEIQDNYPISSNQDIEIELENPKSKKITSKDCIFKIDEEKHFITWNMDLQSHETRSFELTYKVTTPLSLNIDLNNLI